MVSGVIRRPAGDVRPCPPGHRGGCNEGMLINSASRIVVTERAAPAAGGIGHSTTTIAPVRLRILLLDEDPWDARVTLERLRDAGQSIDCDIGPTLREVSADRLARTQCVLIEPASDANGLQALETLGERAPDMPVVVLTRIEDPASALQRSAGEPDIAGRITDHLNGLHQVLQQVRSTLIQTKPES